MTHFSATFYKHPFRRWDVRTFVQLWARLDGDNCTVDIGPPRAFWGSRAARRWALLQVVEFEHRESKRVFGLEMAALGNGQAAA